MIPFYSIPPNEYKPENFFPCVTEEYKDEIRDLFELRDRDASEEELFSGWDSERKGWAIPREPFDDEIPEYEELPSPEYKKYTLPYRNIQIGENLDVYDLLYRCRRRGFVRCVPNTSDSDDVRSNFRFVEVGFEEAFKEKKYVLFFCAFVPAKWCEENATTLFRLSLLSSELLGSGHDDFEIVMVAKMRKNENQSYDDEEAFHTFFSAFPGRLAIPYSNRRARDDVCVKLNFGGKLKVVLVGPAPQYEILQTSSSFLDTCGAAGFPFTDHALQTLSRIPPLPSLPHILNCDPSFCLSTFGSQQTKSISVGELSEKVVGLYLFQIGNQFWTFYDVYNQCQKQGSPFEIVIVCMPLAGPILPDLFQEEVHKLLGSFMSIDISSWWVFPYNNSACLRIEAMFSYDLSLSVDQMIIVGPGGKFVDACGGDVIRSFGIEGYPFIREHLVTKYLERVKEVTLESLLCHGTKDYVVRKGKKYHMEYFQGRNVLLYVDRTPLCLFAYGILCEWYHNIRKQDPSFELVFVCCESKDKFQLSKCILPWLTCCCDPDHEARLLNHDAFYITFQSGKSFIEGLRPPAVIAFGKDGHIHSLDPLYIERIYGHTVNPFLPEFKDLRGDVIRRFSDVDFMRGYGGY